MLFSLFSSLVDIFSFFNVFKYLTVRTGLSMFTSMIVVFIVGNPLINYFSAKQIHNPIRDDGPSEHIIKKIGTPTMGGVIILAVVLVSTILWSRWDNEYVWVILFVTFSFGLIGLVDDYIKVVQQNTKGFSSRLRLLLGFSLSHFK